MMQTFQHSPFDPRPLTLDEMACDIAREEATEADKERHKERHEDDALLAGVRAFLGNPIVVPDEARVALCWHTTTNTLRGFLSGLCAGVAIGTVVSVGVLLLLIKIGGV